jgi:hypothetical protein
MFIKNPVGPGDVTKCLAWCYDNKSKLRKMKSSLEFSVRLQVFQIVGESGINNSGIGSDLF